MAAPHCCLPWPAADCFFCLLSLLICYAFQPLCPQLRGPFDSFPSCVALWILLEWRKPLLFFSELASWVINGRRQATRIRNLYLKMILRQDVSFFDKEMSTTEVAGRMSRDIILIQDAMGEKVASFTGEKQAIDKILTGAMSVGQASPCLSSFAAEQAAAFKIFETIKRKPEIDAYNISGLKLDDIRGDIELRDVYFSYPTRPDEQIFTGFSLSIPSGMTVALVGEWEWEVNSDQSNREKRVEEG